MACAAQGSDVVQPLIALADVFLYMAHNAAEHIRGEGGYYDVRRCLLCHDISKVLATARVTTVLADST